jgi:hypothetical protein
MSYGSYSNNNNTHNTHNTHNNRTHVISRSRGEKESFSRNYQSWSIRLCLRCRQNHYLNYPEAIPVSIQGRWLAYQEIAHAYYLTAHEINTLPSKYESTGLGITVKLYSDEEACKMTRRKHGGDVGAAVFQQQEALAREECKTIERIQEYHRLYTKQPEK